MKMIKNIFLVFYFILFSCKNDPKVAKTNTYKKADKVQVKNEINIDNDFNSFLDLFNTDSIFQVSRIAFPLNVKELELSEESDYIDIVYQQKDHRNMNLKDEKKDQPDAYTISNKIMGDDNATVEVRGIDNGIIIDFHFKKIDGKWMLVTWIDSST